jgi:hypothetical protein
VTLITDIGGSTTDIVAGQGEPQSERLVYAGRYGQAFGGGLYDAELASEIADELNIPTSSLAEDPSALVSLRISAQRLKESLSRQSLNPALIRHVPQRTVTLVMRDGSIYRRAITLDEERFRRITARLNTEFETLMENAMQTIGLKDVDISQVVLVGGGAQLFTHMQHLRQRFGEGRVVLEDNPEETVVHGIGLEFESPSKTIPAPPPEALPQAPPTAQPAAKAAPWRLLNNAGEFTELAQGITRLGRGDENELQIEDIKASRFHARLSVSGDQLEITDLGSTNGTSVNGKRITANAALLLKPGDEIRIGTTTLHCELGGAPAEGEQDD